MPRLAAAHGLRGRVLRYVGVAAFFAAATALWFLPLAQQAGSHVLGDAADHTSTIRNYWAAERQDSTPLTLERDYFVSAPEGLPMSTALAKANAFQPLVILPLRHAWGYLTAWNVFVFCGFVLTGVFAFALFGRLGLHWIASLFGAYVLTFNGYLVEKAFVGHGALVHVWVFPVLLLALLALRQRASAASAVLVGLVLGLAFYVNSYYGLFGLVVIFLFMAVDFVLTTGWAERLWRCTLATMIVATAGLALTPAIVGWIEGGPELGRTLSRSVVSLQAFGIEPLSFLVPSERHPVFGDVVNEATRHQLASSSEPTFFFGYTTLVLALSAVVAGVLRYRRTRTLSGIPFVALFAVALVPVAFLMALPRRINVAGVDIPTFSYFIGEITTFWRVPARFGILVGLGIIVLAIVALDHVVRVTQRPYLGVAALGLVAFELAPGPPIETWNASKPPAYITWLRDSPPGIVANYPLPGPGAAINRLATRQNYYQVLHGHRLYESLFPSYELRTRAVRVLTEDISNRQTPRILAAENVRYVVVHDDVYRASSRRRPRAANGLTLAAWFGPKRIFVVTARPANLLDILEGQSTQIASDLAVTPPKTRFLGGFYAPERWKYGLTWRWMRSEAVLEVENDSAGDGVVFRAFAFSAHRPRTLEILTEDGDRLGSQQVSTSLEPVRIGPFALPTGTSTLRLRTLPGEELLSGEDRRFATILLSEPSLFPDFTGAAAPGR
jgi:hypothetical protein